MNKVEEKIQAILKENNMTLGYELSFPVYKIIPDEVKLALSVLKTHGMKIIMILVPQVDPPKDK